VGPPREEVHQVRVDQALGLASLSAARVVAGSRGLGRPIRWVNVVDIPDPLPWVGAGQLLLTTGITWPQAAAQQRQLVSGLVQRELSGVILAVPKYLPHFPTPTLHQAEVEGLPLIEVPWAVPFAEITQSVNGGILAEPYAVIEESAAIHQQLTQAALTASSLQDLVDVLGGLIDRDVTLNDKDGRILAYWDSSPSLTPPPPPSSWAATARSQLTADDRVVCPIWLSGELAGTVSIDEGSHELSELHLRAAEHAAVVAALHMATQRQLASLEARMGATFLDTLLEGKFDGTAHNLERARLVGFAPEEPHQVGILSTLSPLPPTRDAVMRRDLISDQIRHRLATAGGLPVISARLSQVIFILPSGLSPQALLGDLAAGDSALAVGRPHPGPEGVRRSYQEALSILDQALPGSVCLYQEMLVPRILSGDIQARHDFLEQLFGGAQLTRGGDLLVQTVVALAREGFHRRRTAARLGVHPNTLKYRLDRVSEVLRIDLQDPGVQFRLQLAVTLLSLPHKVDPEPCP